jgi:hypothetical protein
VLADTGRTRRKQVHWLDTSSDELPAQLRVLNGYDIDLAGGQTRLSSRLRDALTSIAAHLSELCGPQEAADQKSLARGEYARALDAAEGR